ncbi:MAG: hypothetical protein IPL86_02370 [Flavobacteriales bacterium]|nr:hypothetical protein [Flavobacteriales bacterium]
MIYLIIITGIALALFLRNVISNRNENNFQERETAKLEKFKLLAEKVEVDLSHVKLKSNSWQEEVVTNNRRTGGYNQLVGRGDLNIENVQRNQNVIFLSVPYKGREIEIQYGVNMDPTTLTMKLEMKKSTTLYVNPNNNEENYLDMDFLFRP